MGVCASLSDDMIKNNLIDQELKKRNEEEAKEKTVLAFGAGESGKTTIFNNLEYLSNQQRNNPNKTRFIAVLRSNVNESINRLLAEAKRRKFPVEEDDVDATNAIETLSQHHIETRGATIQKDLSLETAKLIVHLWNTERIKKTFQLKTEFWLPDNVPYYIINAERIASMDADADPSDTSAFPTYEDVLAARSRTGGVVKTQVKTEEQVWNLVDVGGQRTERTKWFEAFDSRVNVVLYVVPVGGFAKPIFEDNKTNSLRESLNTFEKLLQDHLRMLQKIPIILIFNKCDILRQDLLHGVNIAKMFNRYVATGAESREEDEKSMSRSKQSVDKLYDMDNTPTFRYTDIPEFEGKSNTESEFCNFLFGLFCARIPTGITTWQLTYKRISAWSTIDVNYIFQEIRKEVNAWESAPDTKLDTASGKTKGASHADTRSVKEQTLLVPNGIKPEHSRKERSVTYVAPKTRNNAAKIT